MPTSRYAFDPSQILSFRLMCLDTDILSQLLIISNYIEVPLLLSLNSVTLSPCSIFQINLPDRSASRWNSFAIHSTTFCWLMVNYKNNHNSLRPSKRRRRTNRNSTPENDSDEYKKKWTSLRRCASGTTESGLWKACVHRSRSFSGVALPI